MKCVEEKSFNLICAKMATHFQRIIKSRILFNQEILAKKRLAPYVHVISVFLSFLLSFFPSFCISVFPSFSIDFIGLA